MEYSLGFATELVRAAASLQSIGDPAEERGRALLYLSLLSIEISLKYLLERAGLPVKSVRQRSHSIKHLLEDLCECETKVTVGTQTRYVRASAIRSLVVNPRFPDATVGRLLEAETEGASRYPGEIRYGKALRHYPPEVMVECAKTVIGWAEENGQSIQKRAPSR